MYIDNIENVQKHATKVIRRIQHSTYKVKLLKFKPVIMKFRIAIGGMTDMFKMVHGFYDKSVSVNFKLTTDILHMWS
jgi:hypothetical protein